MDLEILRHSCSHVMAHAVKRLWPDVKLGIGPAIDDGFYYDFDRKEPFSREELSLVEKEMKRIITEDLQFRKEELSKAEAEKLFVELKEDYKIELVRSIEDTEVSIYRTGKDFLDLCRGPHLERTGQIEAFKLLSIAGAYWHGLETNPMLQRIYGTCFTTQKELEVHLKNLDEAKKRDYRKLGPQLELFNIYHEEAGAGVVFYHPQGAILRTVIEDYLKNEHLKRGYNIVITPHIMDAGLWHTSGHYDYYRQNMYTLKVEEKEFVLKPMNCPGHMLIYKSKIRSYRDLPFRLSDCDTLHRNENVTAHHGLLRTQGFREDDAHIFLSADQIEPECEEILKITDNLYTVFGLKYSFRLGTCPDDYIGDLESWKKAETKQ